MPIINVDSANFEAEVKNSDKPVLVDFWAAWCGPCRVLSPFVEEIADELDDIKVAKLDVDAAPDIAREYNVISIPTLILFENGKVMQKSVGAVPKASILEMLGS